MFRAVPRKLSLLVAFLMLAAGSSFLLGEEPGKAEDKKPPKPRVEVKEVPPVKTDNKNTLILKHRKDLKFDASSFWPGWPMEKLVDGDLETSWFSDKDDTTTQGKTPWVQIIFPEDYMVDEEPIRKPIRPRLQKAS